MKDLDDAISKKKTVLICELVTTYMFKNKTKQLIKFFIDQYNRFYVNQYLLVIPFFNSRIQTIRKHNYSITHRITRISMCEIFVLLSQIPKHDDSSMLQKNHEPIAKDYCFLVQVRDTTIDCNTFVQYVLQFIHEPCQQIRYSLNNLVKAIVSGNSREITYELSYIYESKSNIDTSKLQSEPELQSISLSNDSCITTFLIYVMLLLCSTERKWICVQMSELLLYDVQRKHFNMLLQIYDVAFNKELYRQYVFQNPYYTTTVLQCTIKIDYLFETIGVNYPKIKIQKESYQTNRNEIKTNALFTFPEIKQDSTPKLILDTPDKQSTKTIIIHEKKKDKYQIEKNVIDKTY